MPKKSNRWLELNKQLGGKKPGEALAKWLNHPDLKTDLVEDLLMKAQVVYRW